MPPTTAWERKQRRGDVIRLRAQGYSIEEISEETGHSTSTISRDIKRINERLSKFGDVEFLKRHLRQGLVVLYEHEFQDLERAEHESDERAKHRAKQSMRQTLELTKKIEDDLDGDMEVTGGDWFESLDPELQEKVAESAGDEVDALLSE